MTDTLSRDQLLAELDRRSDALNGEARRPELPTYEVLASIDDVHATRDKFGKHVSLKLTCDLTTVSKELQGFIGDMVAIRITPQEGQLGLPIDDQQRRQYDGRIG